MSRPSLSIGSDSLRSCMTPRDYEDDQLSDSCFDTALPPITSKQLIVNSRSFRGSDPSIVVGSFYRGNQKAAAALGFGTDTMANMNPRGQNAHRRTGSTLKTVMRKIFTRKGRSQTDGCDDSPPDFPFTRSPLQRTEKEAQNSQPLSSSLRSKYSDPLREDILSPSAFDEALWKLEMRPPRQRRATLPSLVFSDDDESRDALDALVRSDGAGSRSKSPRPGDDDRRRELLRNKRRSRSATALRSLARHHRMSPIQWRRRSIESYVTSTACGAASDTVSRPPTRATVASAPQTTVEPSVDEFDQDDQLEEEIIPPNLGNLVSTMQHDDSISLEQRLTTLEVKLIDLEFAIARMQTEKALPSPTASSGKRSQSSNHRRKQSTTHSHPSVSDTPHVETGDRPLSTATIRPSTQHLHRSKTLQNPSIHDHHDSISVEQYSALVMLLRREQSARRNLESEVTNLRSDIQQLQQLATQSMGLGNVRPRNASPQEMPCSGYSQTISPALTEDRLGSPGESESDRSRSEPRDDAYRPRWQSNRRVEVGGMI
ncbi:hypothetical protein BDV25DRAFT_105675 [Aspergillus avenaceus]|uniref:Uncharacterized protein n=1 Tax=Aspergillus avenaceus TaxID=36643 RepID=A0A5N6TWM8_ASPAV|nr:hypothetical protein BDV25DRAFT_105675 [Aspergillus avenaceus]